MSRVQQRPKKPIIGLAGGIGAGKSSAAEMLAVLGAAVIDSDRLSHEQLGEPEVVATLRGWWGEGILRAPGQVDRKAIAGIVFRDPSELDRLEKLLYPRIDRRRKALMAQLAEDTTVAAIVLDSPKLFESGLNVFCDTVLFIEADWPLRVRRIRASRGWSEAELVRREKLLDPLDKKKAKADHVVVNHLSIEDLRTQIERVFSSVLASFA